MKKVKKLRILVASKQGLNKFGGAGPGRLCLSTVPVRDVLAGGGVVAFSSAARSGGCGAIHGRRPCGCIWGEMVVMHHAYACEMDIHILYFYIGIVGAKTSKPRWVDT